MPFTYLMTNKRNGTLYCGPAGDMWDRAQTHKLKTYGGFSAAHNTNRLVWFEWHETRHDAFTRERQIKTWKRQWKLDLIEEFNPNWEDLSVNLTEAEAYAPTRKGPPSR